VRCNDNQRGRLAAQVAADFFTVEVWTRRALQRFTVLFFIELLTRKVELGGIALSADGLWMSQIRRNLTDAVDGILVGKRYLIHDRDPLFTAEFLNMQSDSGLKSVKLPRSPNLNAYAERFVGSIKESCLERLIMFGEGSLRKTVHEFLVHGSKPPGTPTPADYTRPTPCSEPRPHPALGYGRHAKLRLPRRCVARWVLLQCRRLLPPTFAPRQFPDRMPSFPTQATRHV
jgi:hypothetical protein